jgi:hypothetical protein
MKQIIVLILIFLTLAAFPQEKKVIKGKSEMKNLFEGQERDNIVKALPDLVLQNQIFSDPNNNMIIDANESSSIQFKIMNQGSGIAEGVTVRVSLEGLLSEELEFSDRIEVGDIQPQEVREITIPVGGKENLETSQVEFTVQVIESNGFDAYPFTMKINTHKLRKPEILIADAAFIADDGENIRLAEPIILKILVQNVGDGEAQNVSVAFDFVKEKENCFLMDNSLKRIGNMKSGDTAIIDFKFTANRRYSLQEIPVKLELSESMNRDYHDTTLLASLNQEVHSGQLIAVEGMQEEVGEITLGELVIQDQEEDAITMRGVADPSKGLNVAKAKQDMMIGDYYALIIGIDDYYGEFDPLQNAVRDAETIEQVLKAKYKFDHFITLYNREATRIQILEAFEDLAQKVKPTDNVFIYYSGHGEYKEQYNRGYWVPVDARSNSISELISNNDIQTALTGIQSKHTLLVSDACFSGEIFRGEVLQIPFENSETYYRKVHERPSRKAITSGGIEPVMDAGKEGHSVFAYYVIKSLESNEDPFYDASQLYERIKIPVTNNSDQQPHFHPIKNTGDEGGQFIFIHKF